MNFASLNTPGIHQLLLQEELEEVKAVNQGPALCALSIRLCLNWIPIMLRSDSHYLLRGLFEHRIFQMIFRSTEQIELFFLRKTKLLVTQEVTDHTHRQQSQTSAVHTGACGLLVPLEGTVIPYRNTQKHLRENTHIGVGIASK